MTTSGERIMMTFNGAGGADHVVVTGALTSDGVTYIQYYDPTNSQVGQRLSGDYSELYAVGAIGSGSY